MLNTIKHDLKKLVCARVWVVLVAVILVVVAVVYRSQLEDLVKDKPYWALGALVVAVVAGVLLYRRDRCDYCNNSPNQEEVLECKKECESHMF